MQEGIEQSTTQPAFPPPPTQRRDSEMSFEIIEVDEDDDDGATKAYGLEDEGERMQDVEVTEKPRANAYGGAEADDDGVEEEEEEIEEEEEMKEEAVKVEEHDDAAFARELQRQLNSRSGGRVRERPRRMVAGGSSNLRGKSNVKVEEEEWR